MADARDLCLLADVKGWIGTSVGTTDDALLSRLITAASVTMQQWMNRTIPSASYSETRNGQNTRSIRLSNYPVTAVSSVIVDGFSIPVAAGNLAQYAGYGFDQFNIYLSSYRFTKGLQNVTLAYTAGYAAVPIELSQACISLVVMRYKERDHIGLASKSMAGETTAYTVTDFPKTTLAMMNNYRKVVPI
jgi:hypothetical protein